MTFSIIIWPLTKVDPLLIGQMTLFLTHFTEAIIVLSEIRPHVDEYHFYWLSMYWSS